MVSDVFEHASFIGHLRSLGRPLVPPDPAREELDRRVDLVLELGGHVGDLPEGGDAQHVQLLGDERPDALDPLQVVPRRDGGRRGEGPLEARNAEQGARRLACPRDAHAAVLVLDPRAAALLEGGGVADGELRRALLHGL